MARVLIIVLALCLAAAVPTLAQNRRTGRCADRSKLCLMWAHRGECYHNAGFMYVHCPESCGQCKVEDPLCFDADDMCTAWAKVGECRRNKPYMEKRCSRACAFCTPAKDHDVPHVHSSVVARIWNEFDSKNTV